MSDSDWHHPHGPPAGWRPLPDRAGATDWAGVCAELVGAHGAAIIASTAAHPDTRRVLDCTGAAAARIADLLYVLGDGPHAVSMVDGVPCAVVAHDADDRARWPVLVSELSSLGVGWVRTYPIRVGDCVIGTVQLHRRTPPDPPVSDGINALLTHLTRVVGADTIAGLLDGSAGINVGSDNVNIAIGVLVARHAVMVEDASALLRGGAYARGHTSMCEAQRIVDSVGGTDPW